MHILSLAFSLSYICPFIVFPSFLRRGFYRSCPSFTLKTVRQTSSTLKRAASWWGVRPSPHLRCGKLLQMLQKIILAPLEMSTRTLHTNFELQNVDQQAGLQCLYMVFEYNVSVPFNLECCGPNGRSITTLVT